VELGAHDVVVVAGEHGDAVAALQGGGQLAVVADLAAVGRVRRTCQFQMRMVWSSEAETIQGYSWWKTVVRM
jgi:hypothetical protein